MVVAVVVDVVVVVAVAAVAVAVAVDVAVAVAVVFAVVAVAVAVAVVGSTHLLFSYNLIWHHRSHRRSSSWEPWCSQVTGRVSSTLFCGAEPRLLSISFRVVHKVQTSSDLLSYS